MSIREPHSPIFTWHSSIASAVTDAATTLLPQDTDSVTVFMSSSVFGLTTLDAYIQTSPDGGTTWYDMANMGQLTATTGGTPATALQQPFVASFDTVGEGGSTVASIAGGSTIGIVQAGASVAARRAYTGVPLMGRPLRIFLKATGTGASDVFFQVYCQNQSRP